ncbi:MAG TPA: hypothetical protein VMN39_06815 [Longimicrobiaceae bacterium]|nr:hypothetical protein [Longimicrobiaceae bacterium]
MIRSAAAVLAGLVVTIVLVMLLTYLAGVLAGVPVGAPPTPTYLALNLFGSAIAGFAGGDVAVRVAAHTPHGHVIALAVVILLLSLPFALSAPAPGQPTWYPFAISVVGPGSVLLGGLLAARRISRRDTAPA